MSKRALVSLSQKSGLTELANRLVAIGIEIIATGGTEKALRDAGIPVTSVEHITKFPECFGGRVKTLHPMITGGILFKREDPVHVREAQELGIEPIDLVFVNLYPFAETLAMPGKTDAEKIEQIDIGGPTMLRSAAKNFSSVTVICDPADYEPVLSALEKDGDTPLEMRRALAAKVFLHTAAYDAMITEYLSDGKNSGLMMTNGKTLRYGENPHQWGKYFDVSEPHSTPRSGAIVETPHHGISTDAASASWMQSQGKELSYLNILDADAAWNAVQEFTDPTTVFVKHANPSGIASHADITEAFQRAYDADRLSAFGVIIATNRPFTAAMAQKIVDQKIFVEVIVAPSYEGAALDILKQKPNIRVIVMTTQGAPFDPTQGKQRKAESSLYRSALGGILAQNADTKQITEQDLKTVTSKKPTTEQVRDLLFAWTCVKYCKSNAIVFAKDLVTVGLGTGQTSRVDSTWIAAKRAGDKANGAVMASDAFFPFPDAVEEAAKSGISAIIQPEGSIRDEEVFRKAEELGLVMVTTGFRVFRH